MKAQVISMANRGGSTITSVSYDDMVRFIDQSSGTFVGEPLKCPSQPQKIVALKSSPDLAVIGCLKHIVVVNGYDIAHTMELNHGVVKLALASDGSKVACSCTDKKVRIYSMTSSLGLDLEKEIPFNADPTNLEFSPDGSFLAVIDSSRVIKVFECADYTLKCDLCSHSARVDHIAWHSDSVHLATGGLDTHIVLWNVNNKASFKRLMLAHPKSNITGLAWADESTVVSSGFDDCNIKFWNNFDLP